MQADERNSAAISYLALFLKAGHSLQKKMLSIAFNLFLKLFLEKLSTRKALSEN